MSALDPGQTPRRRTLMVAIALIVALGVVAGGFLFFSQRDGSGLHGGVFQDDFSHAAEHWTLDSQDGITREIDDGVYRVRLERSNTSALDSVGFDGGREHPSVRVSALVRFAAPAEGGYAGLTCGYAPGDGESVTGLFGRYEAQIGLDGRAEIARELNADEEVLERGPVSAPRRGEESELALTCSNQGDVSTVSLEVDGRVVLEAEDDDPFTSFESAGMYAGTEKSGLEVTFDDLRADLGRSDRPS